MIYWRPGSRAVGSRAAAYFRLIRFEHTLFALPYVYIGLLFAPAVPTLYVLIAATGCAVCARTSAMLLNRIIDRPIDRRNPRTRDREKLIVEIGKPALMAGLAGSVAGLAVFTYLLSAILLFLVPVAVGLFVAYPYTKRFTAGSHLLLGVSLSVAPIGGFLAGLREFPFPLTAGLPLIPLSLAVLFWVAGFDIIYALDDLEFDRRTGLHSVPAWLGYRNAQLVVLVLYTLASALLFSLFFLTPMVGYAWFAACVAAAAVLLWEQAAVTRGRADPTRRKAAFNANLAISPMLLLALALDIWII